MKTENGLFILAAMLVALSAASAQEIIDFGTMRNGVRTCPDGYAITGVHVNLNLLLCSNFNYPDGKAVQNANPVLVSALVNGLFSRWTSTHFGFGPNGWYVGDFNGDGKDDIFRYCPSGKPGCGAGSGAEVQLSSGTGFGPPVSWTGAGFGFAPDGWYVGDFNGDGKDDIFRYCPFGQPVCGSGSGAQVFLSNGQQFVGDLGPAKPGWTGAGYGYAPKGWYVGDFNGDGKDDILFRLSWK
jgi:hypothetical protein